jgi:hypothetical protein
MLIKHQYRGCFNKTSQRYFLIILLSCLLSSLSALPLQAALGAVVGQALSSAEAASQQGSGIIETAAAIDAPVSSGAAEQT